MTTVVELPSGDEKKSGEVQGRNFWLGLAEELQLYILEPYAYLGQAFERTLEHYGPVVLTGMGYDFDRGGPINNIFTFRLLTRLEDRILGRETPEDGNVLALLTYTIDETPYDVSSLSGESALEIFFAFTDDLSSSEGLKFDNEDLSIGGLLPIVYYLALLGKIDVPERKFYPVAWEFGDEYRRVLKLTLRQVVGFEITLEVDGDLLVSEHETMNRFVQAIKETQ